MNKFKITFGLLLINICLLAQTDIDYNPKALQKELIRYNQTIYAFKKLQTLQKISGNFYFSSDSSSASIIKYLYIGRVNTKNSEFFDYFIFYDSACALQFIKVYNYQATHGQEITSAKWLTQFKGYHGEKKLLRGRTVDAITGATISVDAITSDVEQKTILLKEILQVHNF